MQRVKDTGERTGTYEAQAWACVGVCGGTAVSALTTWISVAFQNPDGSPNYAGIVVEVLLVVVAVASGIQAWWSFNFAKQHASDHAKLRQGIYEDMQHIEGRHPPISTGTAPPSP